MQDESNIYITVQPVLRMWRTAEYRNTITVLYFLLNTLSIGVKSLATKAGLYFSIKIKSSG